MINVLKVSVVSESSQRPDRRYSFCLTENDGRRHELNADEAYEFLHECWRLKNLEAAR
jgi:hypothetical protein